MIALGFEGMQQGFLGLTAPDPLVLWRILFGFKRGILWLSPVLVLVPLGLWWGWRSGRLRAETAVCIAVIAYYFLLNASYFYWSGGSSVGPRHTMPAMFFAALPLMLLWQQAQGPLRQVLRGLSALSLFFSLACGAMTMSVTAAWRFPLKDPIGQDLRIDQVVELRQSRPPRSAGRGTARRRRPCDRDRHRRA